MPSSCPTSFLVRPPLLGAHGRSPIWTLLPSSTPPLGSGISLVLLTLYYSPVIVNLPNYSPGCALLGSPFDVCITTLDALSPLMLLCLTCHPCCTLPGSYTTLLNSSAWSLLAF